MIRSFNYSERLGYRLVVPPHGGTVRGLLRGVVASRLVPKRARDQDDRGRRLSSGQDGQMNDWRNLL